MTIIATTPDHVLAGLYSTDVAIATGLPINGAAGVKQPWIARLTVPPVMAPGDIIKVEAQARVTNDIGYNTGVGYHLHAFIVGQSSGTWWRISPFNGDNVNTQRHHMPLHCDAAWEIPATWPVGAQVAVVFKGDAHSTLWQAGDEITVDHGYTLLSVEHWRKEA